MEYSVPIRLDTNHGPLNTGATETDNVTVWGIAKKTSPDCPYGPINELICGELGRLLRLPIPPFCIVTDKNPPWFITLNANLTGQILPPGNFEYLCTKMPYEATGLLLFDILVMNPDRHASNFAIALSDKKSSRLIMFDHGHALLGIARGKGKDRLSKGEHLLGCDAYYTSPGGEIHEVFKYLATDAFVGEWISRINSIPDYFIDSIASEAESLGLTRDDSIEVARVLKSRRTNILTILRKNKKFFNKLTNSLFSPINETNRGTENV